jgi:ATP-dependent protease ClpP protease subunit
MFKLILPLILLAATAIAENKFITLRTDNMLLLQGEISAPAVFELEERFTKLVNARKAGEPLYIVIDSPGGDIRAGNEFIEFAKTVKNVHTISLFAASMASAIVESLPGQRYIAENGTLMFHRAAGGFEGQFEDGEVESRLAYAKAIVRSMEQRNADRMCVQLADYKAKVKNEYWLYGKNAVEEKAADATVDIQCSQQLLDTKLKQQVTIMGLFQVEVESSGCPLMHGMKLVKGNEEEAKALAIYLKTYRDSGYFKIK